MRRAPFAALWIAAAILAGCASDNPVTRPRGPQYLDFSTPENLLHNLETAYHARDLEGYLALLAPEFRFRFRASDVVDLGLASEWWPLLRDSTGTANLFGSNQVSAIRLALTFGTPVPAEPTAFPAGTLRIRVVPQLEIDQTDGITWMVSEQQDMFFRRGLAEAGEDTTRWFLLEWHDLDPNGGAPRVGGEPEGEADTTWGKIKAQYQG